MIADNELKKVLKKHRRAWVKKALKSFDNDPPDSSFQQGYKQLLIEEI